ncbi:hypothetical protein JCM16303_004384 [Sporobolomyces ruberrimus]
MSSLVAGQIFKDLSLRHHVMVRVQQDKTAPAGAVVVVEDGKSWYWNLGVTGLDCATLFKEKFPDFVEYRDQFTASGTITNLLKKAWKDNALTPLGLKLCAKTKEMVRKAPGGQAKKAAAGSGI